MNDIPNRQLAVETDGAAVGLELVKELLPNTEVVMSIEAHNFDPNDRETR